MVWSILKATSKMGCETVSPQAIFELVTRARSSEGERKTEDGMFTPRF